jgi:hypothetical protein
MRLLCSVTRFNIATRALIRRFTGVALMLLPTLLVGCQAPQPDLGNRLMAHVAMVDSSGLAPPAAMPEINVRGAVPQGWETMDIDKTPLYTHQQWRAPNHSTGIGVAYIHMPLPMSAKALVWFARGQYSRMNAKQHKSDPSLLGEWTDSLGREWFEGENEKYHVKGYVVTSGFDAWAVYSGYRLKVPPNKNSINLAYRAMDSIVPLPLEKEQPQGTSKSPTGLANSSAKGPVN